MTSGPVTRGPVTCGSASISGRPRCSARSSTPTAPSSRRPGRTPVPAPTGSWPARRPCSTASRCRLDGALPPHIGIGVCGIVDRDRGAVSHAVNLGIGGDWFPLAARLADRTGATVLIENDVNAATWGAHVLCGADDMAYLSVGTGLAAGFVLSGSLRRGAHGAAAEIGHLPVEPGRPALLVRAARLP